jgi:hypothetical protein
MNGTILIQAERNRQQNEEGYLMEHDDQHTKGELANFACCYALDPMGGDASNIISTLKPDGWELKLSCNENTDDNIDGRIRDLVKAGALIVAEIERLHRKKGWQAVKSK